MHKSEGTDGEWRSAFVGLAVMVVLMPVPAKGAKLMSGVEKKVCRSECSSVMVSQSAYFVIPENGGDRCTRQAYQRE